MAEYAVVIPCVPQHIQYLQEGFASINLQQPLPIEVVVALSSATAAAVGHLRMAMKTLDPTIRPVISAVQEKVYAAGNRNRGVKASTAPIITFIDADDSMKPHRMTVVLQLMQEHKADAVIHGFDKRYAAVETFKTAEELRMIESADRTSPHLTHVNPHHGHITFVRRLHSKIQQNETEKWRRGQDSRFVRDVIRAGYAVIYTPEILSNYHPQRSAERLPRP